MGRGPFLIRLLLMGFVVLVFVVFFFFFFFSEVLKDPKNVFR